LPETVRVPVVVLPVPLVASVSILLTAPPRSRSTIPLAVTDEPKSTVMTSVASSPADCQALASSSAASGAPRICAPEPAVVLSCDVALTRLWAQTAVSAISTKTRPMAMPPWPSLRV